MSGQSMEISKNKKVSLSGISELRRRRRLTL